MKREEIKNEFQNYYSELNKSVIMPDVNHKVLQSKIQKRN